MRALKIITRLLWIICLAVAASALFIYFVVSMPRTEPSEIDELIPYQNLILLITIGGFVLTFVFIILSYLFAVIERHGPKRRSNRAGKKACTIIGAIIAVVGILLLLGPLSQMMSGGSINNQLMLLILGLAFFGAGLILFLFFGLLRKRTYAPLNWELAPRHYEGLLCYFVYPSMGHYFNGSDLETIIATVMNEGYDKFMAAKTMKDGAVIYYFATTNSIRETKLRYKWIINGELKLHRAAYYYNIDHVKFGFKEDRKVKLDEPKKTTKTYKTQVVYENSKTHKEFLDEGEDGEYIEISEQVKTYYRFYVNGEIFKDHDGNILEYGQVSTHIIDKKPIITIDNNGILRCPGASSPNYRGGFGIVSYGLYQVSIGYDYYPKNDLNHSTCFSNFKKCIGYRGYSINEAGTINVLTIGHFDSQSQQIYEKGLYNLSIIFFNNTNKMRVYISDRSVNEFLSEESINLYLALLFREYDFINDRENKCPLQFYGETSDPRLRALLTGEETAKRLLECFWQRKEATFFKEVLLNAKIPTAEHDDFNNMLGRWQELEKATFRNLIDRIFAIPPAK